MKKIIYFLLFTAVILQFTSCEKNGQTNELIGWWVDSSSPYFGYISDDGGISDKKQTYRGVTYYIPGNRINACYHFLNHNTVEFVFLVYSEEGKNAGWSPYKIGNATWYVSPRGSKKVLTYVREDNKILITNGNIFTIMDGKLYLDGSSSAYHKYR